MVPVMVAAGKNRPKAGVWLLPSDGGVSGFPAASGGVLWPDAICRSFRM
jgi:hypothetical protein